jgi:hypothetical protein
MGWTAKEAGFDSQQGQDIFPFSVTSLGTLGSTQFPIQWVPGAFSPGLKHQEREAYHSPAPTVEVNNGGAVLQLLHTSSLFGP